MLIPFSTWPEIEERIERGDVLARTVVVPIGSNEQHGPTGLLGTDWMCPQIIAEAAEGLDGDLVVAPTFNIGMAQHHLAFGGTITLRPSTFMAAIQDWVASLTRHGFERIYFLNGHGGNVATIEAAFAEINADWSLMEERPGFMLTLRNWWELPGVLALCNRLFPSGHGMHATPSEIAVTQARWPESARTGECVPRIAPVGPIRDALDYRARFPDGRIGSDPSLASPELGRQIIDLAAPALLKETRAFGAEQSPGFERMPLSAPVHGHG
ncbi:creatininase family protein [Brevundimonas sp.]|uniref:creatininase family protein n=1 Tax=Brevundimonas sp. TaxID=1871086 RepID=UPI0035AE31A1